MGLVGGSEADVGGADRAAEVKVGGARQQRPRSVGLGRGGRGWRGRVAEAGVGGAGGERKPRLAGLGRWMQTSAG